MTNQRREFLKAAAVISSGAALTLLSNKLTGCTPAPKAGEDKTSFGLQLYTLRDDMPKDPRGILKQVAAFGYKQIESFEGSMGIFWGMKNTEFKKYLDELGVAIVSTHCGIDKDFERKATEAAEIGMKYLICPHIGAQKDLDEYKKVADKFNARGEVCKKAGLRFAYHNHDYSFVPVNNQFPQDVLMQNTNKDLVDFQIDLYWVVTAGQDPIEWIKKYPNRFKLCHIKDRIKNAPPEDKDASTVAGSGQINFPEILKVAKTNGTEYYIVEQERYDNSTPLDAAKQNAEYMANLKF